MQEDLDKEHAKERAERHLRHEFRLMEIEEEDKKESDEHDNGACSSCFAGLLMHC